MAHIAERMVSHYNTLIGGLHGLLLPRLQRARRRTSRRCARSCCSACHACTRRSTPASTPRSPPIPSKKQQFDDGVALAIEIKRAELAGTDTQEQRDTGTSSTRWRSRPSGAGRARRSSRLAITGAAPIPAAILEWFNAIGVPLSEIYGMSESSGPMTYRRGATSPATSARRSPAARCGSPTTARSICRGGNVFVGYLKQPDKTAETLIDGWLHSGDIGVMDDEGYLKIVDRKKELIITSGGKNISPANLEAALKMIPLVGQACAIGDNRKFIAALLVLDPDAAPMWAAAHGKAACRWPSWPTTPM